jgi:hypothetical protein
MASCLSIRPSVRVEKPGSHWTDLNGSLYVSIFRKYVEKIQASLKSENNEVHFK